jgi:hypothetical protein
MRNPLAGLIAAIAPAEETDEGVGRIPADLRSDIEEARQEWLNAKSYFNHVTDPDLIDMAIYSIEAAEKRYMYLLKVARLQGVSLTTARH